MTSVDLLSCKWDIFNVAKAKPPLNGALQSLLLVSKLRMHWLIPPPVHSCTGTSQVRLKCKICEILKMLSVHLLSDCVVKRINETSTIEMYFTWAPCEHIKRVTESLRCADESKRYVRLSDVFELLAGWQGNRKIVEYRLICSDLNSVQTLSLL